MAISLDRIRAFLDKHLVALAIGGACLMLIGGGALFEHARVRLIDHQWDMLNALVDERLAEIGRWERDRSDDARTFASDNVRRRAMTDLIEKNIRGPDWTDFMQESAAVLKNSIYDGIVVLDARGRIRYSIGEPPLRAAAFPALVERAMGTGSVQFGDAFSASANEVRILVVAPVEDRGRYVGAMGFELKPSAVTTPLVKEWPLLQSSAEVFLIRVEDGQVLHLSPRRFGEKKLPFVTGEREDSPSYRIIHGIPGREAIDYRGKKVFYTGRAVPGTPWFLVGKVDKAEAEGVIRELGLWSALLMALFLALVLLAARGWWRRAEAQQRASQYKLQMEKQALAAHFDYLAKYANDVILLANAEGQIVEANDRASDVYGYSREEILGLPLTRLRADEVTEHIEALYPQLRESDAAVVETVHRTRDGRKLPVEESIRRIRAEKVVFLQVIVHDLSERKRSEQRIRRLTDFYATLSYTNQAIIQARDQKELLARACRIAVERGHMQAAWVALADEEGRYLLLEAYFGPEEAVFREHFSPPRNEIARSGNTSTQAASAGTTVYVNDFMAQAGFTPWRGWAEKFGMRATAAFPVKRGTPGFGIFGVQTNEVGLFDVEVLELLTEMAEDLGYACDNFRREEERADAELRVRESEYRYRNLFESMGSAVAVLNPRAGGEQFTIIDVNSALMRREGLTREQLINQACCEDTLPWFGEDLVHVLQQVWRTGEAASRPNYRFEDSAAHKTRWSNVFVYRLPTEELVLIYDDVTERQEAELAVRRSEERLGFVLDATEDYYWDLNFEAGEAFFGPRFEHFFGVSGGPLNKSLAAMEALIHPDDLPEYRRAFYEHLDGRTDRFFSEHRKRTAEAEYIWVRERGRVVRRAEDGRPLRMAGMDSDITFQRRTEEQLRLWGTVFSASREAILITDANRCIVSANPAFSAITGYSLEEALGRDPGFLSSGVQDRAFYQQMWAAIETTDHWAGEIRDRRKNGEIFPFWMSITAARDARGKVQHYIAIASDLTEREEARDRIRYLASHDALTGLPNRMLFLDRLNFAIGNAKRRNGGVGVLFIDLDRFKNVNDSLGQQVGDALLKAVAERIGECVRSEDTVSRQGGDEFLVLLSSVRGPEDAADLAQKILVEMGRSFLIGQVEIHITPSIGIALFPEDGSDADMLVRSADAAMYYAKERGRNNFQFFITELNERARRRLSMETSLRGALGRSEFVLHYQPQVNVRTGEVVGVEALIRWRHEGNLLRPIEFIGMAEETGLIVPIGEWVIQEACRQQREWLQQGMPAIPMAINLSAAQFHHKDAAARLRSLVFESCIEPQNLEIELTESLLMQEAEYSVRMLHALKEAGVRLAIDDFGTGYSSLNYLRRFPVDRLKVDQSFVRDLPSDSADRAVTEAIIALAHSLGVGVIAEGVETAEEMDLLRERACEELQGYYFAPPLSPMDFIVWWRGRLTPR